MEHLLLKATTTAQDQGVFTAVISTSSIDREKDVVDPAGMVAALQKWVPTGKQIPLAWNHSTSADQIIGSINPASAKDVSGEVVVDGQIDMGTDTGSHAWRLIKSGVVGFSFGYLVLNGSKRKGGGRNITELDVFEITATPTPMNNDTRVLGFKGETTNEAPRATLTLTLNKQADAPPTATQLRILNSMIGQAQEYIAAGPDPEDAGEMADVLETLEELVGEPGTEDEGPNAQMEEASAVGERKQSNLSPADETGKEPSRARSVDPLRQKADAVELEFVSDGESLRKPPRTRTKASPPLVPLDELRRQMREQMLTALESLAGDPIVETPVRAPEPLLPTKELRREMREQMLTELSGGTKA